jgi:hypothetical protein
VTAEIAILNKNAVALAADSAVTISGQQTPKVYNTANKLFMLSKYYPVGVMVYGTAYLMGIPWETVIKIYREELKDSNFEHLREFADMFVNHLQNSSLLFPAQLQQSEVSRQVAWLLGGIRGDIDQAVKTEIENSAAITDDQIKAIVSAKVGSSSDYLEKLDPLPCFEPGSDVELTEVYGETFRQCIEEAFGKLPLDEVREQLNKLCVLLLTRDMWGPNTGGIVIAGFGKADIFPVIECYTIGSVIHKRLKRRRDANLCHDVNESQGATIVPFAQAEMVDRFIRGIDPSYKWEVSSFLRLLLTTEYPKKLIERFESRLDDQERRDTQAELIKLGRTALEEFDASWEQWEQKKFISPILDIVADLPKDELAAMAESLVNLTSFKRRISAEAETVGGPIDVAVISKGDGFVWIKRKHYFERDLNPAFFANYYRRE